MKIRKKIVSMLLAFALVFNLMPVALAANVQTYAAEDIVQVSKKAYALAPGVTEYELVTNNSALTQQQVGHIMEVKPGSSAEIRVGYNDYNIAAIASGSNWKMVAPTEQAQNAETRGGIDVVGIVNGDFFNMANGCPSGYTVMQGTVVRDVNSPSYWIDSNGVSHIAENRAEVNAVCQEQGVTVWEALGGGAILIKDGQRTAAGGSYGDIANPRTVVGIKADGTVIIYMVDGRQAPYSVGMTYGDLADIMLNLDCVQAINIDGGGSSAFATQREGEPNNNGKAGLTMRACPSDGYERKVSTSLMVVSTAASDGVFHHATITPNQEIYTPGSTVAFTAKGVDKAGKPAELPTEGLSWSVISGAELGSVDANGVFTGNENMSGVVTVALSHNGQQVGSASIELRWPDKLEFTNNSVSLDFGEASDLTFHPTYQGQTVHYKDGDFVWSLEEEGLTYKYSAALEQYYTPWWQGDAYRWSQLSLLLTGKTAEDGTVDLTYHYEDKLLYTSKYQVDSNTSVLEDGTIQVKSTLTHRGAKLYSFATGELLKDNITEDFGNTTLSDGQAYGIRGLKPTQEVSFNLGSFRNNVYTADENTTVRGTVKVALKEEPAVTGAVGLVVGMEPLVLMDFEDYTAPNGTVTPAVDYWKTKVSQGNTSQLPPEDVHAYRLWIRRASNEASVFPTDNGQNSIVSGDVDQNVRFGQYAFKMGYDFTAVPSTAVAVAEFGFSGDMYINTVQPTKIGVWINVPEDRKNDDSQLKAILKGGAGPASLKTAYLTLHEDGTVTYTDNYQLNGTASYVTYYSYDADGNVTGGKLSDWAGKGWTWVEADISHFQMPVDLCRGYTVRITSPQNCTKDKGYIYLDNLQFIYGTNTNDVNKPVIETITERNSQTTLEPSGSTEIKNGAVAFEVLYNDSAATDKYASGIDTGSVRISIDGVDYTGSAEIAASSLILPAVTLTNGAHTVRVVVKDYYGNETETTRTITINDDAGQDALVGLKPQTGAPQINKPYSINIISKTGQPIDTAEISLKLYEKYLDRVTVMAGTGYSVSAEKDTQNKLVKISITKTAEDVVRGSVLANVAIAIPGDANANDTLVFSVPSGRYEEAGGTATFSVAESSFPLTSAYVAEADAAVKNYSTVITVKDAAGNPAAGVQVWCDGSPLDGATDDRGQLTHTFDTPTTSAHVLYAADAEGGRSWNINIPVCDWAVDGSGAPFGIQNNATDNADTSVSITWMSAIASSQEHGLIRYATSPEGVASANKIEIDSKVLAFAQTNFGDAMRLHSAHLQGLQPGTTYYYQVGDGEKWSEVLSFTTASGDPNDATEFVVMGDIQTDNTANLAAVLNQIKNKNYSFAVQTGDAIDGVNVFSQWRALFTVLNSATLKAPMIHALGNHEYYGAANGEISSDIFTLPESAQGAYYSVEYGSVYVGVINNGGDFEAAVAEMKEDAAKSDCQWKILVMHEPVYGTTEVMPESHRKLIADAAKEAGIEFVFGGDHHAYARTYPMLNDAAQAEDSRDGVVYFVSGDLSSKSNEFKKYDYHVVAIPHVEYGGCYLTVKADANSFTVQALNVNGEVLDTYTRTRSDCQQGNHKADENSVYNMADKTIVCSVCGKAVNAEKVGYSGLLATSDDKQVILAAGKPIVSKFTPLGEAMYHSDANGYAHLAKVNDPTTCVKGGQKTYECEICNVSQRIGDWIMPTGHDWNEEHICKRCGFHGIDINTLEAGFLSSSGVETPVNATNNYVPTYYYQSGGVRPSSYIKHNGQRLTWSNDANVNEDGTMRDLYVSWSNDRSVGKATINFVGKGDYYGERTLTYKILPNDVKNLQASEIEMNAVTLTWSAAPGAGYYRLYQCNANGDIVKTIDANITGTSYKVSGLKMEMQYYFKMAASTKVDGEVYNCPKWSAILPVKTAPMSDGYAVISNIQTVVDGQTLDAYISDIGTYIFLPASADVTKLNMKFTVKDGLEDAIVISGNKSESYLFSVDGHVGTIDVPALASQKSDGTYELSVTIGDYKGITVTVMQGSDIPTVYLTSSDPVQDRQWVDADKEHKATGSMLMVEAAGTAVYNGTLSQIKARGNSTFAHYPKKAYQIKLSEASDLLGNREQVKTWVLLANYGDATMMHDQFFKELATEMGMYYVASTGWVNLYYDGEYRGVYMLSEKNAIDSNAVDITDLEAAYEEANTGYGDGMITKTGTNAYGQAIQYTTGLTDPADITGGYLIELNHNMWDEASGFMTKQGVAFNVKSPEWLSEDAVRYISEYYQVFEDAVYAADNSGYNAATGKYYYDYVDADSLVKIFLIQELGLNPDGFISSLYFYKDVDGKMYAGPVWDQDMTLGTGWTKYLDPAITDYHYLAKALIRIPDFQKRVSDYYVETFAGLVESKRQEIDDNYAALSNSAAMNYVLWDYIRVGDPAAAGHIWNGVDYASVVENMKSWIDSRMSKLEDTLVIRYAAGDVNMDGAVNSSDAVAILRYLAGYSDADVEIDYGDFNGDGTVNSSDAVAILRFLAGLD